MIQQTTQTTSPDTKHGKKKKRYAIRLQASHPKALPMYTKSAPSANIKRPGDLIPTSPQSTTKMAKRLVLQTLQTPFPCSRRKRPGSSAARVTVPSPLPRLPQQDRLQTALLYLARAAAQLPPASAAAESLYEFAAPNWTFERWSVEVEGWLANAAGARGESRGGDGEMGAREKSMAGDWVRRAVGVLKKEGEEGEYWRDGRDLEVLWGRVGGDCV